jgi:hypothetical protein
MFSSFLNTCSERGAHSGWVASSSTLNAMCKLSLYIYQVQYLTSWNTILEELTHPQLAKKSPHLTKTSGSLPFSLQLTTCPYPDPNKSSLRPHSIPLRSILILSTHLRLGLTRSVLMRFRHQNLLRVSILSHTCHMPRPFHPH